jgi:integrase
MPGSSRSNFCIPKHSHHKASGRGVVRLNGRDRYTGPWGSATAEVEYRRLIAEWLANHRLAGRTEIGAGTANPSALTVAELILAFWRHVQTYYRQPDGSPTGEEVNYRYALRPLRALYGDSRVADFTPFKLKAVRQDMIAAGLARTVINSRIARMVRMFRWGVQKGEEQDKEGLVPEALYRALTTVDNLQAGRSEAREPEPIKPVPAERVEATLPFLSRQVRTMVELQRVTALRSTEVCRLRGAEIDTSGEIWEYRPAQHKTRHRGKERVVFIGPRGQELLKPWLKPDPMAFLFSPREAMEERRRIVRESRLTGARPSRTRTRKRKPKKEPWECYTYRSYGYAIRRACARADVASWHPHQLRHTRATEVRKAYKLEGAQVALGHSHAKITETYAEGNQDLARQIAAETG